MRRECLPRRHPSVVNTRLRRRLVPPPAGAQTRPSLILTVDPSGSARILYSGTPLEARAVRSASTNDRFPPHPAIPKRHLEDRIGAKPEANDRSEEHTSELQSHSDLVCRLLLEKKKIHKKKTRNEKH